MRMIKKLFLMMLILSTFVFSKTGEGLDLAKEAMFTVSNLWILLAAFLVFIMHLGFSTLESGLTRAKNTVNILFKNVLILSIGILTYALIGFNLMYPGESWIFFNWFGFGGFGIESPKGVLGLIDYADGNYSYYADFLFQAMFAATAATIISGAVAERIKLSSFVIFSILFVGLVYPILGSWKWGGGWLDQRGFYDFAGSTLVHSVGGWGALVCAFVLGSRMGKYDGKLVMAIRGHSLPLATIGTFLLWFGWFGFNGGSVLSADAGLVAFVCVTTALSASGGIIGSAITSKFLQKKPDLSMVLNGALAGLVGITAGADVLSISAACLVGLISGVLVVFSVIFIDSILKVDDPVGAISVHLVCGIWGTLAVGLFSKSHSFMVQLLGVGAYGIFTVVAAFVLFMIIKIVLGVRVSEQEELMGLDASEHAMEAYSGRV